MKTLYNTVLCCLCLIGFLGCTRPAYQDYQALEAQQHNIIYNSSAHALQAATPRALAPQGFTTAQIRITDPVFRLGGALANFQVYESGPLSPGAYRLDVQSNCIECRGYRRKQVLPYIVLQNNQGKDVATFKQSTSILSSNHFGLHFNLLSPDSLKILMAADNRQRHKADPVFLEHSYNSINIPITQEYGPEGDIRFKLSKIE